jgi:hypothetical protein
MPLGGGDETSLPQRKEDFCSILLSHGTFMFSTLPSRRRRGSELLAVLRVITDAEVLGIITVGTA